MRISDSSSDVCSSDLCGRSISIRRPNPLRRRRTMAELAQRERLQPSLLDRLRDDDPRNPKDAIGQQSQSARGLRESLLRDLGWLLNSRNLASVQDLSAYPEVARSVVNFGLRSEEHTSELQSLMRISYAVF